MVLPKKSARIVRSSTRWEEMYHPAIPRQRKYLANPNDPTALILQSIELEFYGHLLIHLNLPTGFNRRGTILCSLSMFILGRAWGKACTDFSMPAIFVRQFLKTCLRLAVG